MKLDHACQEPKTTPTPAWRRSLLLRPECLFPLCSRSPRVHFTAWHVFLPLLDRFQMYPFAALAGMDDVEIAVVVVDFIARKRVRHRAGDEAGETRRIRRACSPSP